MFSEKDCKLTLYTSIFSIIAGQNYVFDVKHTSREVYDSTKRKLFKSQGIMGSDVILSEHQDSVAMEIDSDDSSSSDIFQENEVNNSN